ncbi:hypothetical protein M0802_003339 [Mischocyttarus mexicanus]|nr:hypothetical protein M0802_003339 [Mischocyttarus mexicanus]
MIDSFIIKNTSDYYKYWSDTSEQPSTSLDFYFFNWTNPYDFTNIENSENKPNLVEIGPYSFVEVRKKVKIKFHELNGTVSYFNQRFWYFDEKNSKGTLKDQVYLLDSTIVTAMNILRLQPVHVKEGYSNHLSKRPHLGIMETIDDLVIAADKITFLKRFNEYLYLSKRNGSVGFSNFNVATGKVDYSELGLLKKWNYKNTSSYFGEHCNQIEGSLGDLWPPGRDDLEIKLFIPDICRALIYEFEETVDYMGMNGNKYVLDNRTLENNRNVCEPWKNSDNIEISYKEEVCKPINLEEHCYCKGECNPIGFINIGTCNHPVKTFFSLPHFYKAEPSIGNQFEGLNPNEENHSSYIILEPKTGIPLEVAKRIQVNVLLDSIPNISHFHNLSKIYFPIFWYSEKTVIPKELASEVAEKISLHSIIFQAFITSVVVASSICCLIAWYYHYGIPYCKKYHQDPSAIELDVLIEE